MKIARGSELVIASHNPGKVQEIRDLLRAFDVNVRGASELGLAEPEETGTSFAANAELKARAAADASGCAAIADDSGLVVEALGGAPGIYSARWAGPTKDFRIAIGRLESELGATSNRRAKFVCALAIAEPKGPVETFIGEVEGTLTFPPRGDKGFGYDPIFVAEGMDRTFGEIEPATKHAISHRARAFEKLVASGIFVK